MHSYAQMDELCSLWAGNFQLLCWDELCMAIWERRAQTLHWGESHGTAGTGSERLPEPSACHRPARCGGKSSSPVNWLALSIHCLCVIWWEPASAVGRFSLWEEEEGWGLQGGAGLCLSSEELQQSWRTLILVWVFFSLLRRSKWRWSCNLRNLWIKLGEVFFCL